MADFEHRKNPAHPPWPAEARDAGSGVWFFWNAAHTGNELMLWHWCDRSITKIKDDPTDRDPAWYAPQWVMVGTQGHDLVSEVFGSEPTLSPSVYWPYCCKKHGFLTNGVWTDC